MKNNVSFVLKTPWLFLATCIAMFCILSTHYDFDERATATPDPSAAGTIYVVSTKVEQKATPTVYVMIPDNFMEDCIILPKNDNIPF